MISFICLLAHFKIHILSTLPWKNWFHVKLPFAIKKRKAKINRIIWFNPGTRHFLGKLQLLEICRNWWQYPLENETYTGIVWGCCLIRHRCTLFQKLQLLLEFITHCYKVFYTLVRCCSSELRARSYIKFNRMSSVRCDSVCSVHILCSIVQCVTGLRRQEAKRVEN